MTEKTGKNRQTRPVASSLYLCSTKPNYIQWFGTDGYIEANRHITQDYKKMKCFMICFVFIPKDLLELCGTLIKNTNSNKMKKKEDIKNLPLPHSRPGGN